MYSYLLSPLIAAAAVAYSTSYLGLLGVQFQPAVDGMAQVVSFERGKDASRR